MANSPSNTLSINDQLPSIFNRESITQETDSENLDFITLYPSSSFDVSPTIDTNIDSNNVSLPVTISELSSDNNSTSTIREDYHPRTIGEHNIIRLSILPIFPSYILTSSNPEAPMPTTPRKPHFLLANVPLETLTDEQYAHIRCGAYSPLFKLEMNIGTGINPERLEISSCESFLLSLYRTLYIKIKKRLKIDIPVIDFNLIRLRNCIGKVVAQRGHKKTMLNLDELVLALEFYLQIDVDIFFLKTCSFNNVKPRLFDKGFREGLFCIDPPEARFSITPCNKKQCLCCHSPCPRRHCSMNLKQIDVIPFSTPYIHRFINQYEAFLNCPATCETKYCIYVLTCPCQQFDFIGETKLSFAEILKIHREEGNRIVREFLLGESNINHITHNIKSDEKKANDKMWLYQHSARCSIALQFFLDYNPDYWCFVPMKSIEVNMANTIVQHLTIQKTNETISWARTDEEAMLLMNNVPKPPLGFDFSFYQRQQQIQFFQLRKDCIVPKDHVDLYNADIIAILPNNSSKLFRQLIESLLITHAECKLNEVGDLVYDKFDPNYALHNSWCANLTRRPLS